MSDLRERVAHYINMVRFKNVPSGEMADAIVNGALEEAAKVCDRRYMGDNNREDMEARRCAAAIRALKEKSDE